LYTYTATTHTKRPRRTQRSAAPRTHAPTHDGVMRLQESAGNRAVTSLVAPGPVVQRGLFDMVGNLLGDDPRRQAAALAGRGVASGVESLGGMVGGPFGQILGGSGQGLAGAAQSLVSGDTGGALSGLQSTGAAAAQPLAQSGMGLLGGMLGGPLGGLVGGMGSSVGEGLTSVITGGSPVEAGRGVADAAAPGLLALLRRFLPF
jgi:hypothetical protein